MSDFEDDAECLRIHLGERLNISDDDDSSDSEGSISFYEEYNLLRPSPIPPEIIRQRSIHRPPSPKSQQYSDEITSLCKSGKKNQKGPKVLPLKKSSKIHHKKGLKQIKCAGKEKSVLLILETAEDLVDRIYGVTHGPPDKLSMPYIEALEEFRINVDHFGDLIKVDHVTNFTVLLSNFYAFVISEFLLIIRELHRVKRNNDVLFMKSLELIGKIGSIDEVKRKIHFRNSISLEDLKNNLNIWSLVTISMTNGEILNYLKMLSPLILESKKIEKTKGQSEIITTKVNEKAVSERIYTKDVFSTSTYISESEIVTSSQSVQETKDEHKIFHEQNEEAKISYIEILGNESSQTEKKKYVIGCEDNVPNIETMKSEINDTFLLNGKKRKIRKKKKVPKSVKSELIKPENHSSVDLVKDNGVIHQNNHTTLETKDESKIFHEQNEEANIAYIEILENESSKTRKKYVLGCENNALNVQKMITSDSRPENLMIWYIKQVQEFNRQDIFYDMMNTKKYFLYPMNKHGKIVHLRKTNLYNNNVAIGVIFIASSLVLFKKLNSLLKKL